MSTGCLSRIKMHELFDDLLGELVNQIIKCRGWWAFVIDCGEAEDNVDVLRRGKWQVFLNGVQGTFIQVDLFKAERGQGKCWVMGGEEVIGDDIIRKATLLQIRPQFAQDFECRGCEEGTGKGSFEILE